MRDAGLSSLQMIHQHHVYHHDIRSTNITWKRGARYMTFFDFERAQVVNARFAGPSDGIENHVARDQRWMYVDRWKKDDYAWMYSELSHFRLPDSRPICTPDWAAPATSIST